MASGGAGGAASGGGGSVDAGGSSSGLDAGPDGEEASDASDGARIDVSTDVEGDRLIFVPEAGPPTSCADAAAMRTNVGCEFWPTVTFNPVWSVFDFAAVVANATALPATIQVDRGGVNVASATVPPGSSQSIRLPWVSELKGGDFDSCTSGARPTASVRVDKGAYHLTSTVPVSVWQFNPLDYRAGGDSGKTCPYPPMACNGNGRDCLSISNDGTILFPSSSLTGNYRLFGKSGARGVGGASSREAAGSYAITATRDATTVTVHVVKETRAGASGAPSGIVAGPGVVATPALGKLSLQMNAGDVVELLGVEGRFFDELHFDLSGSLVFANQPVQVISTMPITDIPVPEKANNGYADHCEETVPPAETIGQRYLVAPPAAPLSTPVGHYVRFYGSVDQTALTYPSGAPPGSPTVLDAAQVVEIGPVATSFEVVGNHPFAIASFMMGGQVQDPNPGPDGSRGDPALAFVMPVQQFRKSYVFVAPVEYELAFANIVIPDGANVNLDGVPLAGPREKIGTSTWSVVRAKIAATPSAHVIESDQPVGVHVALFGNTVGVYYGAGTNLVLLSQPPSPPP